MADTKSTIDSCSSVRDLKVARCRQFNDLLDKITDHIEFHSKRHEVANGVDDITYAASTLSSLINDGIRMAVNCAYFGVDDAD